MIDEEERVLDRWKEYFGGLLDGGVQSEEECSRQDTESWLEEGIGIEEVIAAIAKLKNGKAPGICGVSAEMLKAGGSAVAKWLHRIINLMWTTGEVPADWTKAVIVPIHKKGSKMICSNYRGISLLSIPCKVYTRILDGWVRSITESKVMEVQGGFRRGRSCVDQVFTIRQLSEKVLEKNGQMAVACVDLEKAYDNVCREKLWRVLDEYGVKGNLMKAIRSLYARSQACVRVGGKLSEWFSISQGVRQGCVLSPWLFNVFMDRIMREVKDRLQGGVHLTATTVKILLFADDIVVCTEKKEDMERNLGEMNVVMKKWGMKMHWGKTKVMMVSRTGEECKISVEGEEVEEVEKLNYLGVTISGDGGCDDEIEQRIGAAARVVGAMRKEVLEGRELQKKTKMRVFNAMVVPTLLYGCETWTVQKRHESKIQAFEMMCLRRVEGVTRMDRVRNVEVRKALGQEAVMDIVKEKQKKWKEKLEEMSEDRLVKKVYMEEARGRRPRGRPRKRWQDNFPQMN